MYFSQLGQSLNVSPLFCYDISCSRPSPWLQKKPTDCRKLVKHVALFSFFEATISLLPTKSQFKKSKWSVIWREQCAADSTKIKNCAIFKHVLLKSKLTMMTLPGILRSLQAPSNLSSHALTWTSGRKAVESAEKERRSILSSLSSIRSRFTIKSIFSR